MRWMTSACFVTPVPRRLPSPTGHLRGAGTNARSKDVALLTAIEGGGLSTEVVQDASIIRATLTPQLTAL